MDGPIVFQSPTKIFLTSEMFRTLSGAFFERRRSKPCKKYFEKIIFFGKSRTALAKNRNFDMIILLIKCHDILGWITLYLFK